MYSATFTWEPGDYDDEFHRLNDIIEGVAQSLDGYLGVESWQSADGARRKCGVLLGFAEHAGSVLETPGAPRGEEAIFALVQGLPHHRLGSASLVR